jgi:hypothetical protein
MGGISYTGASGTIDSFNQNLTTGITTTPYTLSTTVVGANAWIVGGATGSNGEIGGGTAGSGTTYRSSNVSSNIRLGDSNGTVGTGSRSLNFGRNPTGSGDDDGVILSIVPAPVVINGNFLAFM